MSPTPAKIMADGHVAQLRHTNEALRVASRLVNEHPDEAVELLGKVIVVNSRLAEQLEAIWWPKQEGAAEESM